jgi:class 3 adenylate cyclase
VSTARGDGALPEHQPTRRASDADRTQVVDRLRLAAGDGLIGLDELEERLALAYSARTLPELAPLTADLPAETAPPPADRAATRGRRPIGMEDEDFRGHLTTYCLVIGMLIGIWLLGGAGHFWPFYPAAGWGIGLGAHYQSAATEQRKLAKKARAEGLALDEYKEREEARRHEEKRAGKRHRRRSQGAPPELPPGEAPTRFVVAMFVDVVGSTSLNEALGDQQWVRVRTAFRQQVRECAEAHGGWEANTSGDGVLVRFAEPAAAAGAATEILRRLDRQRTETGFAPSVRIGIHSGDAMEEGDDILGNVVNLAARVTDAADVDEILVTEHVADHLDGRHTTAGRGLHTLKGIARPRHLLALVWR